MSGNGTTTIVIRPQVSNGIVNLKTLSLVGRFNGVAADATLVPINALAMFRPVSFKISNFNKNFGAYGEIYC